jgi:hypothetical protein
VGDAVTGSSGHSHEIDNENACADISSCSSGGSENWVVLSISGDKPIPRFNVYISFIRYFYSLHAYYITINVSYG